MAKINQRVAPYYNDHDSSKQYTQLLALPGRVAQAREITQIQSVVRDIIKSIGDSILKDGNIIEGCQVIVNPGKTSATVTAGKVYLDGMVLPVAETSISITGKGTETIGFRLVETLITEEEDYTLRDPAQGYDNFNQPGCHRIKSGVAIVKDDPDSAILTTLIDGAISVEKYAPDYDVLTQTLARRTYDESGSYIVEGLNVRVEANNDPSKFNVVIESGKAYVLGYELRIPAPRRIVLSRSTTYNTVTGVLLTYSQDISSYELSNSPYVRDIISVKGSVSKAVNQTISSNTDRVLLDELEGIQITSVYQGDTTYTVGTSTSGDCYLQREGTRYYLKWNGTDNYPALNTTYVVAYTYTHTFKQGTDYELIHNTTTDGHELSWITSGEKPLDQTNITVDYNQYLARKDLVYIDQYGNISVIQGTPAEYGFETISEAPINTLPLASIMSPPGGMVSNNVNTKIAVSNIGLTRFTMNDIQNLLSRVRTIEYDQAVLALNEEARQYETATNKRGIFTDPLIDFSKVDYYYNLIEGVVANPDFPTYQVAIDFQSNLCYLPIKSNLYEPEYNDDASTANKYSRTATLAKTGERVVLSQMNATKPFLINPYSMFPQYPEISIEPAVDNYIDPTIITVPVSAGVMEEVVETDTRYVEMNNTSGSARADDINTSWSDTVIGRRTDKVGSSDSIISEETLTYMRPRDVDVEGSQFYPNLDNIKCYFDGVLVPLTPTGSTVAGTESGTIKADAGGKFTAKFTIPENILKGTREVRLESDIEMDGYENSAFALYQGSHTLRTIQRTVTEVTKVLLRRVTTVTTIHNIDPVGQTFVLDRMTMISGIDLYFAAKPSGNTPVTCDIREVVNGTITSTIYGHRTLSASEVNVSSDSRVATRFTFDDPVLLEENKEYAFVVKSTSPSYQIWVADLGGNDVISGDTVLSNPYMIGVMMSSSNNSSWTAHQTTDVKFRLVEDTYSDSAEVLFNEVEAEDFSRIYLLADTIIPDGTTINWFYSTDSGTSFKSISPYSMSLLDQMKSNITIKATMTRRADSHLSPILAIDSVGTVLSSYYKDGCYISRNITGLDEYTNVDIVIDTSIISNTSLHVYVSTGGELIEATLDDNSTRTLNYGWKEQTYKVQVPKSTQCRVFIKLASDYEYFTPAFRRLRAIMS